MNASVRIAIDATPVITGATGVARYAVELLRRLPRYDIEPLPYALGRAAVTPPAGGIRHVPVPLRVVHASWHLLGFPRAEHLRRGAEIVHALDLIPGPTKLPLVMTVHDVAAVERPDLHPPRSTALQKQQIASCHRADLVLVNSAATRDGLTRHGVDPATVVVTPLGRTPLPAPSPGRFIDEPFLLAVGQVHPRKGYDVLLRAFARADVRASLVLAGGHEPDDDIARLIDSLQLRDRVHRVDHVPDAVLASLYRDATALCFPSHAEGFGLPVLEAAAQGLPVIASDLPSVREILGPHALYVRPGDADSLAEAMHRIGDDSELRTALIAGATEAARPFTWDRTASLTAAAYRSVLC